LWWAVPFAGLLLSIALMPLAVPHFWHAHFGKVAACWAAAVLLPLAAVHGLGSTAGVVSHVLVDEYLPFVILLLALFTVSGGIYVGGQWRGGPPVNVALMAVGAVLASLMGTTGASMLLIRPLLRANAHRVHRAHVVVFFIFIVSNAGGSLTPLGDPPLFLGFLRGVDFFWTVGVLWPETLFLVGTLLAVFAVIDRVLLAREPQAAPPQVSGPQGLTVQGWANLGPLLAVVALVLMSGLWKPGVQVGPFPLQQAVRDLGLLAVTAWSWAVTPSGLRARNGFSWAPMAEVAKLFAGIFITMVPVMAMLRAGTDGPFAAVVRAVTGPDGQPLPWAYFWFTGGLSSFLDNAPTYLVFFQLAGGDAQQLMGPGSATLAAISAGAVFMGANTYIGNAPNFMVKAIAEDQGVRMPSFLGYMVWSGAVLLPLFLLMTWVWIV